MANGSLSPTTRIACAVNVYVGSFRHPLEQLHSFSMTCENSRQQVRLGENRGNSPRAALNLDIALARTGVTDQQLSRKNGAADGLSPKEPIEANIEIGR